MPENERKQKAERNIKLLQQELQRLLIVFLQKQNAFVNVIDDVRLKNDDENNKRCVQGIFSMIEAGNDLAVKLQHEEQLPYILYQLGKGKRTIVSTCFSDSFSVIIVSYNTELKKLST